MVIYDRGDSDLLIQSLSENLKSATAIFDKINQGTQHLNSVIDSGVLSGAAYRAGQSLFQSYISPMIQKLSSAITDIRRDLETYKRSEQEVRYLSSHLDEVQLNEKLVNTNQLISLIEQKIEEDRKLIQKFMSSGFEGVANGLTELPELDRQLDNLKHLKNDYEKKLQALQTFSSTTTYLFTDSLQAFKYALQGVELINQSKANSDGIISFPAGADMSWSKKLQAEKLNSSLPTENELIKKYKKDPAAIEAIKKFSSSMSISIKEAENLYLQFKKIGKDQRELDKIKKKLKIENTHLRNMPKVKRSDKLKDFTAKKIIGNYGAIEVFKLTSEESIASGKHDIISNTKEKFGTSESFSKVRIGNIWGGSSTLASWSPPDNDNIFNKILSSVNLGKQNFGYYNDFKPQNINVGISAQETLAEINLKQFSLKIPFTGTKVTIGGSFSLSAGVSAHLTSSKKDGFSGGIKLGAGPGAGISLKIK